MYQCANFKQIDLLQDEFYYISISVNAIFAQGTQQIWSRLSLFFSMFEFMPSHMPCIDKKHPLKHPLVSDTRKYSIWTTLILRISG